MIKIKLEQLFLTFQFLILLLFFNACQFKQQELFLDHPYVLNEGDGIIDLRKDIPDGQYFVVNQLECGEKDTLLKALMKNGKRNGKWTYYNRIDLFSCETELDLEQIDVYKHGYLIHSLYNTGSGNIKTYYQENQVSHNGDKKIVYYNYDNGERMIDSTINEEAIFRFEFDKEGILKAKTLINRDTYFVQIFYPSGIKSDEYRLVNGPNKQNELFDGEVKYWNEEGKLIEVKKYEMGRLIDEN